MTNYGTVNWNSTTIYGRNNQNAQIYNYGLWNAQTDNGFVGGNEGGTTLFDNYGTFLKSGNTGTTTLDGGVVFNNTGLVIAQSGSLNITLGSGNGSTFQSTNSGIINFVGNPITFTNTNTFSGANVFLSSGANFGGPIVGTLNWNSGYIGGALTVPSNSIFNISCGGGPASMSGLVFTNYGTVNWTNATLYGRNNLAHISQIDFT